MPRPRLLGIHGQTAARHAFWVLCFEIQNKGNNNLKNKKMCSLANFPPSPKKKTKTSPEFLPPEFLPSFGAAVLQRPGCCLARWGAMRNAKPMLSNANVAPTWNITSTAEFSSRSSHQLTAFLVKIGTPNYAQKVMHKNPPACP